MDVVQLLLKRKLIVPSKATHINNYYYFHVWSFMLLLLLLLLGHLSLGTFE